MRLFERVVVFMRDHPEPCTLTVGDLIVASGASRATLYRAFQPHGGVQAYLKAFRLTHACGQLSRRPESIKAVAARCGFKSASHFSRTFARAYGLTPSAYASRRGPRTA